MIFFLGFQTTSYVLNSSLVILIHALTNQSSKVSKGLFQMLHQPLPINFTLPYLHNQYGIKRIDVLILVALSIVRSKKSLDLDFASSKISSNTCKSMIHGLLVNFTWLSKR